MENSVQRDQLREQDGMTLIEIIAVIVLIGLLWVTIGKNVFQQSSGAKAMLNQTKMHNLQSYLSQYKLQFNHYPSKLDDLVHPSAEGGAAGEVFTPLAGDSDMVDVYKNNYVYTPQNNGRSYTLKSFGEDGVEGGPDDVTMGP